MGQAVAALHRLSRSRAWTWPAVVVAGAGALGVGAVVGDGPGPIREAAPPRTESRLPRPVEPAFTVDRPHTLRNTATESQWAVVARPTEARVRPATGSKALALVQTETPEGTSNIVAVLGRARDARGRLWVRVRLAVLPNGTTGWVPRASLGGYGVVRTRLVVELGKLKATLYRGYERVFEARIGAGQARWPTPTGRFYIRNRLTGFNNPFYGPLAFGTSARSEELTDWPAGGFVGIHGTNRPGLLPGLVSHGCIRMANRDIRELGRLMPVGTPVVIRR